jgi:glycosyltransferase involved in cell wall biosynthesis
VAIDLRPLQVGHQNRGIGNYLLNILEYFPNEDVDYIFIRYSKSDPVKDYGLTIAKNQYKEVVINHHKFGRSPKKVLWFLVGLVDPVFFKVKLMRPNIFFQPDYLYGMPRGLFIKKVVVAYDLIPFLFKNMYMPSWKKFAGFKQRRLRSRVLLTVRAFYYERRFKKGLRTLRRANKVLSISKTTTNDLIKIGKVSPKRIKTVYLAPSFAATIKKPTASALNKTIKKISGKYLLFIGGTDSRRQVHEIVFAFNLLNARGYDYSLVLAGNEFVENSKELNSKTRRAIELSSYSEKIHMLGKINEQDKKNVMQNAFAFVYPTLYEGFGLPILESMAMGTPVITYRNPATEEIAGKAALYAEEANGWAIYKSVLSLNDDSKSLRDELITRGLKRAAEFDWQSAGSETVSAIFTKN